MKPVRPLPEPNLFCLAIDLAVVLIGIWWFLVGVALAAFATAAALYNEARTGSWFASGYGRQGTLAAFTTPIAVGLLGLLVSSGKGLLWFAPITALAPASFVAWRRRHPVLSLAVLTARHVEAWTIGEVTEGDGGVKLSGDYLTAG